jgi:hypothetical protein
LCCGWLNTQSSDPRFPGTEVDHLLDFRAGGWAMACVFHIRVLRVEDGEWRSGKELEFRENAGIGTWLCGIEVW